MGDFPTAEEQDAAMADRRPQEAQERVERREKLGQKAVPEPELYDSEGS